VEPHEAHMPFELKHVFQKDTQPQTEQDGEPIPPLRKHVSSLPGSLYDLWHIQLKDAMEKLLLLIHSARAPRTERVSG